MRIRCATERKCGELRKYWVQSEISRCDNNSERSIASFGMVKTLGNILPEVMAGIEPGLTPKSARFLPGRDQKARRIHWSLNAQGDCAFVSG